MTRVVREHAVGVVQVSRSACGTVVDRIGGTPLIQLNRVTSSLRGIEVYAKAEWFNPGGSVKDRPALRIIRDAEARGELTPSRILLDSTSGNTGIAYAMIGAVKGYRVELVVPANLSEERKRTILAYGATLHYSDPLEGSDGAIRKAQRMAREHAKEYYFADQYNNPSNPLAHYETTAVEILEQTDGAVTHVLAGIGTGGTVMGLRRRLKEENPAIQVLAVEPSEPLHGLEGLKHMEGSIVPGIYREGLLDGKIQVRTEDAYAMVRRLALEEGLFVGSSSGAALCAALELAGRVEEGLIVIVFPDGGS